MEHHLTAQLREASKLEKQKWKDIMQWWRETLVEPRNTGDEQFSLAKCRVDKNNISFYYAGVPIGVLPLPGNNHVFQDKAAMNFLIVVFL